MPATKRLINRFAKVHSYCCLKPSYPVETPAGRPQDPTAIRRLQELFFKGSNPFGPGPGYNFSGMGLMYAPIRQTSSCAHGPEIR